MAQSYNFIWNKSDFFWKKLTNGFLSAVLFLGTPLSLRRFRRISSNGEAAVHFFRYIRSVSLLLSKSTMFSWLRHRQSQLTIADAKIIHFFQFATLKRKKRLPKFEQPFLIRISLISWGSIYRPIFNRCKALIASAYSLITVYINCFSLYVVIVQRYEQTVECGSRKFIRQTIHPPQYSTGAHVQFCQ